jgi:CoA:oxalate CoA-transferase
MGPLEGLRIIDFTHAASGPYCTKLLATYGATVIKIERPGSGDVMRYVGPFVEETPGQDRGLAFLHLNTDKLGVTLNLRSATGKHMARQLIAEADVVVENFHPGTMEGLGLGYKDLRELNPRLVMTSISNFGQTGPYRDVPASEIVLYAMGHAMFGTGQPDAEPISMAPNVNLHFAGQTAAVATVGAVLGQRFHGHGEWIDVSIMETFTSSIDRRAVSLTAYDYTGERMERMASVQGIAIPPTFNPCADGYFHITVGTVWWLPFVEAVGESFLKEERFAPPLTDPVLREEFDAFWLPWCLARTKREIVQTFQAAGLPVAPVNSIADILDDPQLAVRGYFRTISHPVVGAADYCGAPFVMHDTPGAVRRPAPTLGQHNAEVFGALGHSRHELAVLASAGVI